MRLASVSETDDSLGTSESAERWSDPQVEADQCIRLRASKMPLILIHCMAQGLCR